ncbi:hypothetical protein [Cystobacter ferrugineus]|nr:hypothetical protein [Cystobacter ferrugineus]
MSINNRGLPPQLASAASRSSSPGDTLKLMGAQQLLAAEIDLVRKSNVNG